jgi:hypothetical protein
MAGLLPSLTVGLIFIFTVLLTVGSVEAGYRWAKRRTNHEKEAPVGALVGAVLGLLAFLLAVTFNIASDTFIARKQALIDDANAIGTAYLRTGLIAEPHRSNVRRILATYVDERLHWAGARETKVDRSATQLLDELWAASVVVGQQKPDSITAAIFIQSINAVIDAYTQRVTVRIKQRIPGPFWVVLYIISALGLGTMGYYCGIAGTERTPVMHSVAFSFAAVIVLIIALDRPGGVVTVDQAAMIELRDSIAASMKANR